jgi:hypothetical protein
MHKPVIFTYTRILGFGAWDFFGYFVIGYLGIFYVVKVVVSLAR